jgi:hypothetical protein
MLPEQDDPPRGRSILELSDFPGLTLCNAAQSMEGRRLRRPKAKL